MLQPGHKWNNLVFHNHTGLSTYPLYAMGGGYVISGDVVETLVDVNRRLKLKFTPIEDATLGFWLMSMDLRHIDHHRFYTWAAPCCFKAPMRREGQRIITRFQMQEDMQADLCSDDPWLVLHKIDSPTKMRYVGSRVTECYSNKTIAPDHIAPSLAPYILRDGPPAEDETAQQAAAAAAAAVAAEAARREKEQAVHEALARLTGKPQQEQQQQQQQQRPLGLLTQQQAEALLAQKQEAQQEQQPGAAQQNQPHPVGAQQQPLDPQQQQPHQVLEQQQQQQQGLQQQQGMQDGKLDVQGQVSDLEKHRQDPALSQDSGTEEKSAAQRLTERLATGAEADPQQQLGGADDAADAKDARAAGKRGLQKQDMGTSDLRTADVAVVDAQASHVAAGVEGELNRETQRQVDSAQLQTAGSLAAQAA
jgi:hypothetical protein